MSREKLHQRIQMYLFAGIAATLPFSIKLNNLFIILAFVHALASGNIMHGIKHHANRKIAFLSVLFFLCYLLSVAFSTNTHEAWLIVERRLSLLVFPVILLNAIPERTVRIVKAAFVISCAISLLVCLYMAIHVYIQTHDRSVFFYHSLSAPLKLNAVYLSAYFIFSIHILLEEIPRFFRLKKAAVILLVAFLVLGCVLLSSKMMLFILVFGAVIRLAFTPYLSLKTKIVCSVLTIASIVISICAIPNLRQRFLTEWNSDRGVFSQQQFRYDTPFTGTSLRVVIWKTCYRIMNREQALLTGVGTGDYQDLLNASYHETGMYTGNPQLKDTGYIGYGPHNQYLETVFSMGIPALIIMICFLGSVLAKAIKQHNNLLLQLIMLLTLFCCTESVLSTNKGIVFFLFFLFLLLPSETVNHSEND